MFGKYVTLLLTHISLGTHYDARIWMGALLGLYDVCKDQESSIIWAGFSLVYRYPPTKGHNNIK